METGILLQAQKCSATGNCSPHFAFLNCFVFALSQVQFPSQRPAVMMKTSLVRLFKRWCKVATVAFLHIFSSPLRITVSFGDN